MDKKRLFNFIAAGLFIVATVLWFAVAAVKLDGGNATYSFLDMTFGKTGTLLGVEFVIFKFSVLNFLTFVFLLVGIVFAALRVVNKGVVKGKAEGFVLLGVGVVVLVLVLLVKAFVVMPNVDFADNMETLKDYKLTAGAIITAVLAAVGGASAVVGDLLK